MQTVTINGIFDAFFTKCKEKIAKIESRIVYAEQGREAEVPAYFENMKHKNLSYLIDDNLVFTNEYQTEPRPTQSLEFLDVNKKCILSIKIYYRYKDEDAPAPTLEHSCALAKMHTYCDR